MNDADNKTSDTAIDSLTNYETVKYFTAEDHEVERYDQTLVSYMGLAIKTRLSQFLLNFLQILIISITIVGKKKKKFLFF